MECPCWAQHQHPHEGIKDQCQTFFFNDRLLTAVNLIPALNTRSTFFIKLYGQNTHVYHADKKRPSL